MHPDFFLSMYHQQERELEQRLSFQLAAREHTRGGSARSGHHLRVPHLRAHRRSRRG